ncbi:hypothetical protein JCM19000A_36810 [Silvimonas sp. JCM 19000]
MKKLLIAIVTTVLATVAQADPPHLNTAPFVALLDRIGQVGVNGNLSDPHYVGEALQCQVSERHIPAQKVRGTELPAIDFGYLLTNCPLPQAANRSFLYTTQGEDNNQPGKVTILLHPFDDGSRLPLQKVVDLATSEFGQPECKGDEDSPQYCVFRLKGEHNATLLILGMRGVLMNIALQN